jgi:hypothetical protein
MRDCMLILTLLIEHAYGGQVVVVWSDEDDLVGRENHLRCVCVCFLNQVRSMLAQHSSIRLASHAQNVMRFQLCDCQARVSHQRQPVDCENAAEFSS